MNIFFEEILIKAIEEFNNYVKTQIFTFRLRLPIISSIHGMEKNIKIDDRIEISKKKNRNFYSLIIKGHYNGTVTNITRKIHSELYLIFSVLEFLEIIDQEPKKSFHKIGVQKLISAKGKPKIDFTYPLHKDGHINIVEMKNDWKKYCDNFIVSRDCFANSNLFYLLSDIFENNRLRYIINFFNSDDARFDSYNFLKYWQAIEVMLMSPEKDIEERLANIFKVIMNTNDDQKLRKLWKIRCKIVHDGDLGIATSDLFQIKCLAQNLFMRIFSSDLASKKVLRVI